MAVGDAILGFVAESILRGEARFAQPIDVVRPVAADVVYLPEQPQASAGSTTVGSSNVAPATVMGTSRIAHPPGFSTR